MYPVGTFSVFTLKRTDTTLDLSQTAEKVRFCFLSFLLYIPSFFIFIMGIHFLSFFHFDIHLFSIKHISTITPLYLSFMVSFVMVVLC